LSPRPAPVEFAQEILRVAIEAYLAARAVASRVFFERGILDALGMLDEIDALTREDLDRYVAEYRYFHAVFLLPPWQQIYRTDAERDQTFAESVRVHDAVCRWYARCGYDLVMVPRAAVEERCTFVLETLERCAG